MSDLLSDYRSSWLSRGFGGGGGALIGARSGRGGQHVKVVRRHGRDGSGGRRRRPIDPITAEAHATRPGRAVTITYDWDWAPGAGAAYRAAHGLTDDDDLAAVEFDTDEEAAGTGSCPARRFTATCAPTRTSTGTPTCTARPARRRPWSRRTPRTRPPKPPARPTSAAGSGGGTPSGGPRPRPAPSTSRRCWPARPRPLARWR